MGAWGTAIFSDDTAGDVRDRFRELIGKGLSTEQATDKLFRQYASSLNDPDDGSPFWLGLAVTQWKCGRLLERVKAKALDIMTLVPTLSDGQEMPNAGRCWKKLEHNCCRHRCHPHTSANAIRRTTSGKSVN